MCDTLCVHGDQGLIFAKNSDRPPSEAQVVRTFAPRVAGRTLATQYIEIPDHPAFRVVGSQPTWLWGLEHGVNEHGLVVGNEKVWTTDRPQDRPPALLGMDIVRLGLERARTADDALEVMTDLIETYGQGGSGEPDADEPYDSSFLIADRSSAWILETSDRTWAAKPTDDGAAISNRISLGQDWTRASADVAAGTDFQLLRDPTVPTAIADHRLRVTNACVSGLPTDPAEIRAALRDHGAVGRSGGTDALGVAPIPTELGPDLVGVTVCMHVLGFQATTASMIVSVPTDSSAAIRAWCALGSPCVSVYVPIFPFVGLPPALSEPTTWSRFAALRDRAEGDPDALSVVRARLAPLEDELWSTAAEIGDDDLGAQQAFTETVFARVEASLRGLAV